MIRFMKILFFQFLIFAVTPFTYAENSKEIVDIKKQFNLWQPIIKNLKNSSNTKLFFELFSGNNFEKSLWVKDLSKYKDEIDNFEYFLGNKVVLIKNDKLGTFFQMISEAPSGDWGTIADFYYWSTGELFFIYWEMFTTQSKHTANTGEGLIISRRLYFNKKGELVNNIETIRGAKTKKEMKNEQYNERDVKYWLKFTELPFYDLIL